MNKHNNLVWIVACMSVIFGLVVIGDGQVYGAYKQDYAQTPAPAYALQRIIEEFSPQEKIADSTLTNGIGPGEPVIPQSEPAAPQTVQTQIEQTDSQTGQTQTDQPAPPAGSAAENQNQAPQPASAPQPEFVTADMPYFDDACFIGDSFTQGLSIYSKNPNADYYYYVGVGTKNLGKVDFTLPGGDKGNLWDALGQKQYGKVYILLGINELGNDAPEVFAQRYGEVIKKIQELQPGATIFIQSILHTTQQKSSTTNFKNEIVNKSNDALKSLADGNKVFYVDINTIFDDETGALRSDISGDGVHIKANCYIEWRDYLLRNVPANLVPAAQMSMAV